MLPNDTFFLKSVLLICSMAHLTQNEIPSKVEITNGTLVICKRCIGHLTFCLTLSIIMTTV